MRLKNRFFILFLILSGPLGFTQDNWLTESLGSGWVDGGVGWEDFIDIDFQGYGLGRPDVSRNPREGWIALAFAHDWGTFSGAGSLWGTEDFLPFEAYAELQDGQIADLMAISDLIDLQEAGYWRNSVPSTFFDEPVPEDYLMGWVYSDYGQDAGVFLKSRVLDNLISGTVIIITDGLEILNRKEDLVSLLEGL